MEAKSKKAAGLLAIFLGAYGVHNFYMGYTGKAIFQLILTIVGTLLSYFIVGLIPVFAVLIWTIIEGIIILSSKEYKDARGIPLA